MVVGAAEMRVATCILRTLASMQQDDANCLLLQGYFIAVDVDSMVSNFKRFMHDHIQQYGSNATKEAVQPQNWPVR
jgi:hypothetical protein